MRTRKTRRNAFVFTVGVSFGFSKARICAIQSTVSANKRSMTPSCVWSCVKAICKLNKTIYCRVESKKMNKWKTLLAIEDRSNAILEPLIHRVNNRCWILANRSKRCWRPDCAKCKDLQSDSNWREKQRKSSSNEIINEMSDPRANKRVASMIFRVCST